MRHVFDADVLTLADPLADPQRAREVQAKVKELISAERHRADKLVEEILQEGTWALPGLINATLVWADQLENNELAQTRLEDLMYNACQTNEAAADLLLRTGILECPFPLPRTMARRVLEALPDWHPSKQQAQAIHSARARFRKIKEYASEVDAWALLLRSRNASDYNEAVDLCKQWLTVAGESAGQLLAVIVRSNPEQAEQTVTEVLRVGTNGELRMSMDYAIQWVDPLSETGLLPHWLETGVLLRISVAVIKGNLSNKAIERLWRLALRDFVEASSPVDFQSIKQIGTEVRLADSEVCYRYWFMSLAGAGDEQFTGRVVDYLGEQLTTGGSWAVQAGVQLIFLQSRGLARAAQKLDDWKQTSPAIYRDAFSKYEKIKNYPTPVLPKPNRLRRPQPPKIG